MPVYPLVATSSSRTAASAASLTHHLSPTQYLSKFRIACGSVAFRSDTLQIQEKSSFPTHPYDPWRSRLTARQRPQIHLMQFVPRLVSARGCQHPRTPPRSVSPPGKILKSVSNLAHLHSRLTSYDPNFQAPSKIILTIFNPLPAYKLCTSSTLQIILHTKQKFVHPAAPVWRNRPCLAKETEVASERVCAVR